MKNITGTEKTVVGEFPNLKVKKLKKDKK